MKVRAAGPTLRVVPAGAFCFSMARRAFPAIFSLSYPYPESVAYFFYIIAAAFCSFQFISVYFKRNSPYFA
jgi:hypothetical protein